MAWEGSQIGLARQEAAHAADGILDAALLPGCVGIAKEGLHCEIMQRQMAGELGTIVEGDGLAQCIRQGSEQMNEMASDTSGGLTGKADGQ